MGWDYSYVSAVSLGQGSPFRLTVGVGNRQRQRPASRTGRSEDQMGMLDSRTRLPLGGVTEVPRDGDRVLNPASVLLLTNCMLLPSPDLAFSVLKLKAVAFCCQRVVRLRHCARGQIKALAW